ncbi:MAG: HD domain-containing protein [Phototrophicaceae bacterium]
MKADFVAIWEQAQPYLTSRHNLKHTLYCYYFAEQLLAEHPTANEAVVLTGILLHDVGWSTVPEDKQLLSFGPHMQYPDLRRQHEIEGVRIATEIMHKVGTHQTVIDAVNAIIDGHDTRAASHSLDDSLVRDADKLWRYTDFGFETLREWFRYSDQQQMALLQKWINTRFFTDIGRSMARGLYGYLVLKQLED